MSMQTTISRLAIYLLSICVTSFGVLPVGSARAEGGQAFSISPPLVELNAKPGETVTASIKLTNISSGSLLIKSEYNDFGAKDESGDPNIIFDKDQETTYTLRHWISEVAPFTLASKASKTVSFPIVVPKDAEPGGHYAVIRFTGTAPEVEQSGVALSASIGSLVLLNVAGNVQENAAVADFFSASSNLAKVGFFESGPVSFVERINNTGNIHVKPAGTIDVFNMFGQKMATIPVNNDSAKNVLPKSVRRFEQAWNADWAFGYYRAELHLAYGTTGQVLTSNVGFWIIPYRLIGLVILVGIGLFFGLRYAIRRYNRHIIAKAGGKHKLRLKK